MSSGYCAIWNKTSRQETSCSFSPPRETDILSFIPGMHMAASDLLLLHGPLQGLCFSQRLAGFLSCFSFCQKVIPASCTVFFDKPTTIATDMVNNSTAQIGLDCLSLSASIHHFHFAHHLSISLVPAQEHTKQKGLDTTTKRREKERQPPPTLYILSKQSLTRNDDCFYHLSHRECRGPESRE